MKFNDLYSILEKNKYYAFSYEDILAFYPAEKKDTLKELLCRWRKKGWIYTLKKGLYELIYPCDFNIPDMYIANRLYEPSYVSLETALSNYSIIPEAAMAVTSVTTKATRRFKNKHGLFIYRTVKPMAFTGYYIQKQNNFPVRIAEPEKALVDFIYFKNFRGTGFNPGQERLDKGVISRLNKRKLRKHACLYNIDLEEKLYAYL